MANRPTKVQHLIVGSNQTILLEPNYVNIGVVVGIVPVDGSVDISTASDTTIRQAVSKGLVRRLTVVCPQVAGPAKITTVLVAAANCPKTSGVVGLVLNATAGAIKRAYFSLKVRYGG
jgi:hypothetical protein